MQGIASYSQVVAQRKCPWGTTKIGEILTIFTRAYSRAKVSY